VNDVRGADGAPHDFANGSSYYEQPVLVPQSRQV
jgi:hypothetical protein